MCSFIIKCLQWESTMQKVLTIKNITWHCLTIFFFFLKLTLHQYKTMITYQLSPEVHSLITNNKNLPYALEIIWPDIRGFFYWLYTYTQMCHNLSAYALFSSKYFVIIIGIGNNPADSSFPIWHHITTESKNNQHHESTHISDLTSDRHCT